MLTKFIDIMKLDGIMNAFRDSQDPNRAQLVINKWSNATTCKYRSRNQMLGLKM